MQRLDGDLPRPRCCCVNSISCFRAPSLNGLCVERTHPPPRPQIFDEFDTKKTGEIPASELPNMLSHLSMKKGKKLDGVKADVGLGETMVLNDFIKVAATMHARKADPVQEDKKKKKDDGKK